MGEVENKIQLHKTFWTKTNPRPLIQYQVGSVFPTDWFSISGKLLSMKRDITPEMINVEDFLPDYERMYNLSRNIPFNQSFWTAGPYAAIPWMEAMLGCKFFPGNNSFVAEPCISSPKDLLKVRIDFDGPWVKKYCEFLTELDKLSGGRFPVGSSSIMRGFLDCLGAVLGQTQMIYALYDDSYEVEIFLSNLCEDFISLIELQYGYIKPFHDGSVVGRIWAPDKRMLQYQDDLTAIASPWAFEKYLTILHNRLCEKYEYSYFHLHPASYIILDNLLNIENLGIVQTQKDVGGPSLDEMLPYLLKILEKKKMLLCGDFTINELESVFNTLPPEGLFLNILIDDIENSATIMEYVERKVQLYN